MVLRKEFPVLIQGDHHKVAGVLRLADNSEAQELLAIVKNGIELDFSGVYLMGPADAGSIVTDATPALELVALSVSALTRPDARIKQLEAIIGTHMDPFDCPEDVGEIIWECHRKTFPENYE